MESLLSILLIVGLVALSSSNRKKKAQRKQAQQKRAFAEAAQMNGQDKKSRAMEEWQNFLKETAGGAAVPATMQSAVKKQPDRMQQTGTAKTPAKLSFKAAAPKVVQASRPKPAPAPEVSEVSMQVSMEGMISTQGESAEEQAAHLAKIHTEEERLHQTQQTLQEIRNLNRKKLRSAVVMSEVLGKPVSLRSRNYR